MRIILDLTQSLEENAAVYYELAKKLKKKMEHATAVLNDIRRRKDALEKEQGLLRERHAKQKIVRKKEWYEKFHWFFTSSGFFVIGGRDATTNELVIKKHTEKHDIVFHTELSGSPFFVLKTEGKEPDDASIEETAAATACYSRAWKMGLGAIDVFFVKPEQVSKVAQSGEYISKGSFMIRGKKERRTIMQLAIAIGKKDDRAIGGPVKAVSAVTTAFVVVRQGREKQSDIAKKIARKLDVDSNEVVPFLPAGGLALQK